MGVGPGHPHLPPTIRVNKGAWLLHYTVFWLEMFRVGL